MKEAFEKIVERLEEYEYNDLIEHNSELCEHCKRIDCENGMDCNMCIMDKAKEIVQEVEKEYNNGWIACSDRLPEEPFGCLVTVMDCEPSTQTDFENILPYFVGYDGHSWNDADGEEIPFEVIAWMPLPEPYKEND